jgi:hypothetical protein
MEYCITVYVETFVPGPPFRVPEPVPTSWGLAWRPDEEGRFFWPGGLCVLPVEPSPFLTVRLPPSLQSVPWQALFLNGAEGLGDFEQRVNRTEDEDESADIARHPLLLLLQELLAGQRRWAVFFTYDCDDIASDYQWPLDALPQIVIEAYRYHNAQHRGFSCCDGA